MRLGAVYINEHVNAFYRVYLPMMALRERGHEVVEVLQRRDSALPVERLQTCDLVHIHRPLLRDEEVDVVARLQAAGVAVGFDDDDLVDAAPPELAEIVGEASLAGAQADFAAQLDRAADFDIVTTPSPGLATRFEEAGAERVHVIENYLPGAFGRVQPEGHDGLVIGWHAGKEHQLDFEALELGDVLRRVLDAHPHVHVVTLGIDLALDHERYRREEGVPIGDLTRRLADFDIGIAPVADVPFNRGRSNVKVREYAAAGVPWLASPVGAYRGLGQDQGGALVEDEQWLSALDELIRSSKQRARLHKRARKWAERETIWRMAGMWEQAFLDTIADVRALA